MSSLAQSRFDWERVLRELSLIIPEDIWLLKMTGTVNPAVSLEGGAEVKIRDSIEGPALEIVGCGPDQDAVAGFVAALEDIDGVTRVGVDSSSRSDQSLVRAGAGCESGGATEAAEDCRYEDFDLPVRDRRRLRLGPDARRPPRRPPRSPRRRFPPRARSGQLAEAGVAADTTAQSSAAQQTAQAQEAADALPGGGG